MFWCLQCTLGVGLIPCALHHLEPSELVVISCSNTGVASSSFCWRMFYALSFSIRAASTCRQLSRSGDGPNRRPPADAACPQSSGTRKGNGRAGPCSFFFLQMASLGTRLLGWALGCQQQNALRRFSETGQSLRPIHLDRPSVVPGPAWRDPGPFNRTDC
jgi:hypothetical protein